MNGMFKVHTVTVEPYLGPGPTGDLYGPAVACAGLLDDGVFREDTPDGETLVQRSVFYADLEDAANFAAESRVTLPSGRKSKVVRTRTREGGGLFSPVAHLEVTLS